MWISPHLLKFPIYFVGPGGQLSWVYDLRPLSYLEHVVRSWLFDNIKNRAHNKKKILPDSL